MKKPNLYSNLCMYNTNNDYARSREDVALYSEYSLREGNCFSRPLPQTPVRQPLLPNQTTPNIYDKYGDNASEIQVEPLPTRQKGRSREVNIKKKGITKTCNDSLRNVCLVISIILNVCLIVIVICMSASWTIMIPYHKSIIDHSHSHGHK